MPRPASREYKELLYRRICHAVQQRLYAPSMRLVAGGWRDVSLSQVMGQWPRFDLDLDPDLDLEPDLESWGSG